MGTTIRVGRPTHLYGVDVVDMVNDRYGREEITDACAVTIASWWQGPRGAALAFAQLASTGTVDVDDLSRAIGEAYGETVLDEDHRALDMLGTWARDRARTTRQEVAQ